MTRRATKGPAGVLVQYAEEPNSPDYALVLVTKRRKHRPDKARDRGPRKRTVQYAEEADRAQHRVQTGYMGNSTDREHG